ncbi:MAG: hypothetical protein K0R12_521 [Gammaproteobacteria bacterium]|jgi:uncharacterized protein (DUF924 family)|nr:hypothetical protein [Gammaproteobacteria bacterium]
MPLSTYSDILSFWFGDPNQADIPTPERTALWFGIGKKSDDLVNDLCSPITHAILQEQHREWLAHPEGRLALIVVLDQFVPRIFREDVRAFSAEQKALNLCLEGMQCDDDQRLTLMERAFFYMPMVHVEDLHIQKNALLAYETLVNLSMPELVNIFKSFYDYAYEHYKLIVKFHRFPQRNMLLGRDSTPEEKAFLEAMHVDGE